jgi:hypothetical protein
VKDIVIMAKEEGAAGEAVLVIPAGTDASTMMAGDNSIRASPGFSRMTLSRDRHNGQRMIVLRYHELPQTRLRMSNAVHPKRTAAPRLVTNGSGLPELTSNQRHSVESEVERMRRMTQRKVMTMTRRCTSKRNPQFPNVSPKQNTAN